MFEFHGYRFVDECITSLKDVSRDSSNGVYPTESDLRVIDFDKAVKRYVKSIPFRPNNGLPPSADALIPQDNGSIVLIEFKNCEVGDSVLSAVRTKAFSSLVALNEMCGISTAQARTMVDFVLVYRKASPKWDTRRLICQRTGAKFTIGGLDAYEGYCFREVRSCLFSEFEASFLQSCSSALEA